MKHSGDVTVRTNYTFDLFSRYRGVIMGLQIILVVFFHFTGDCKSYDVRFDGFIEWFNIVIGSSGVDIFLLVSGLGLYYSWRKKPDFDAFFKKRVVRLLVPYFIFAIPAWAIMYALTGRTSVVDYLADLFFISFFTDGTRRIWYILMAFICYLIFPLVYRAVEGARDFSESCFRVVVLCMATTLFLVMLELYYRDLYSNIAIAVSRFPAFFLGVLLGKMSYEKREFTVRQAMIAVAVALVIAWPLGFSDKAIIGVYAKAFLNFSLCLVLVSFLHWWFTRKDLHTRKDPPAATANGPVLGVLSWFGKYTLEIYMVHVVVRYIFKTLDLFPYRISVELVLVVVSIIIAVLLAKVSGVVQKRITRALQ